ncbi:MAG: SpoIIE family protein phosphatase, partial [Acidobacteria bacterium]|nr:SpoIIE family protein phosphatase [Acidobacteriota bacterium]
MTSRWLKGRETRNRHRPWSRGRDGDQDLGVLRRAFEHWCRRAEPSVAGLYLKEEDGRLRRVAAHGGDLPERLATPAFRGCTALELPGAWLLAADAGEMAEEAVERLFLAASTRTVQLADRLRQQTFQARYRGVELEALYDVGLAVVSTLDLHRLSEEILLRAVSLLDARRGALYELDGSLYRLRNDLGGDAAGTVEATDEALAGLLGGEGQQPGEILPGCSHALAVTVEGSGAPPGLLLVGDKESRVGVGPFSDLDQRTLGLFARQAGIALENAHLHRQALEKERLEREMQLASDIQRQILPAALPRLAGWELAGWNRPARVVGGDYYDVRELSGDRLLLVVADVAGKGMPAALLVSNLHSALRLLVPEKAAEPALVDQLNRHVLESSLPNKFITLLLVEIDRG